MGHPAMCLEIYRHFCWGLQECVALWYVIDVIGTLVSPHSVVPIPMDLPIRATHSKIFNARKMFGVVSWYGKATWKPCQAEETIVMKHALRNTTAVLRGLVAGNWTDVASLLSGAYSEVSSISSLLLGLLINVWPNWSSFPARCVWLVETYCAIKRGFYYIVINKELREQCNGIFFPDDFFPLTFSRSFLDRRKFW